MWTTVFIAIADVLMINFHYFFKLDSTLIFKVDDYVRNETSSTVYPPSRVVACYYKCEYESTGLVNLFRSIKIIIRMIFQKFNGNYWKFVHSNCRWKMGT